MGTGWVQGGYKEGRKGTGRVGRLQDGYREGIGRIQGGYKGG